MKTRYYVKNPFNIFNCLEKGNEKSTGILNFLKHPVGKGEYGSYICPFGKVMIVILCLFLIFRIYLFKSHYIYNSYIKKIIIIVLIITFLLSFMNINAMIYLIPFFLIESYLISRFNNIIK
jgi:hypothetical protein